MIRGDLLRRMNMNKARLLGDFYSYPSTFTFDVNNWPGDFPGRTILALTSLYKGFDGDENSQKEIMDRLHLLFDHLHEFINEDYYFGNLLDEQRINEQQLSGNSWYLRGLCLYYEITKDKKILNMINHIVDSFLIKLYPHYSTYPISERKEEGTVSGFIVKSEDSNWALSSDVGCAFILLDGYVSAYEVTKRQDLYDAIKFIIQIYKKIDFIKLKCQTHATLTCSRAILRFFKVTNEVEYFDLVEQIFDLYVNKGMTLDYQNMNWFGRPDTWTEPCCIVDSWILAKELFILTQDIRYLRFYNRIATNGLTTLQRNNGGAGCTTVTTDKNAEMKMVMYEAFFCCSMRLGEGMRYLSENVLNENDSYFMFIPESFENDIFTLEFDLLNQKSFKIKSKKAIMLKIYVPNNFKLLRENEDIFIKDNFLIMYLNENCDLVVNYELSRYEENNLHYIGDQLLTKKDKTSLEFSPLYDSSCYSEEELATLLQYLY